jgi:hypothetical protein
MHPSLSRRLAALGLAAAVATTLVACGDDDDDAADAGGGAGGGPATTATADGGDTGDAAVPVEACDAFVDFSAAFVGDPAALAPAGEALVAALPDDLASAGTALSTALGQGEEAMGGPELSGALSEIGDALYEGCESDAQLDVGGVDYAFEGLPDEVAAGRVALRFTNRTGADEPHELVLMKRNPGTTEPVDELLALPQDQVMSKLTMVGVVFAETPDESSALIADLDAGSYVAICMIPVGGAEEGEPHALHGMVAELEVA